LFEGLGRGGSMGTGRRFGRESGTHGARALPTAPVRSEADDDRRRSAAAAQRCVRCGIVLVGRRGSRRAQPGGSGLGGGPNSAGPREAHGPSISTPPTPLRNRRLLSHRLGCASPESGSERQESTDSRRESMTPVETVVRVSGGVFSSRSPPGRPRLPVGGSSRLRCCAPHRLYRPLASDNSRCRRSEFRNQGRGARPPIATATRSRSGHRRPCAPGQASRAHGWKARAAPQGFVPAGELSSFAIALLAKRVST